MLNAGLVTSYMDAKAMVARVERDQNHAALMAIEWQAAGTARLHASSS